MDASKETYVSAVRMDTQMINEILNYRYLLDWIRERPVVKLYPSHISNEIEILNHLSQTLNS